jgi:hypothetical protein
MPDVTRSLELLSDLQQILRDYPHDTIATTALLAALAARQDRCDTPMTGHRLARLLKGVNVHPGPIHAGTARGYRRAVCEQAFARYLCSTVSECQPPTNDGPTIADTHASSDAMTLSTTSTVTRPAPRPSATRFHTGWTP